MSTVFFYITDMSINIDTFRLGIFFAKHDDTDSEYLEYSIYRDIFYYFLTLSDIFAKVGGIYRSFLRSVKHVNF